MSFKIVTMKHKGLLFEIVTMKHKELLSKIVTMPEIRLRIIFFLLVFLILGKLILNCRTNLGKKMVMTSVLMWLNLSVATLNTKLQFLDLYIDINLEREIEKVYLFCIEFVNMHVLLLLLV